VTSERELTVRATPEEKKKGKRKEGRTEGVGLRPGIPHTGGFSGDKNEDFALREKGGQVGAEPRPLGAVVGKHRKLLPHVRVRRARQAHLRRGFAERGARRRKRKQNNNDKNTGAAANDEMQLWGAQRFPARNPETEFGLRSRTGTFGAVW
jgi:hypothetical protein